MAKTHKMRVNLAGALANASAIITTLVQGLKRRMDAEEFDNWMCELQPELMTFTLREAAQHVRETVSGKHSLEDFADTYCLKAEE